MYGHFTKILSNSGIVRLRRGLEICKCVLTIPVGMNFIIFFFFLFVLLKNQRLVTIYLEIAADYCNDCNVNL